MRNHKKIKAIRSNFGIQGYAIWVMIIEHLTGNDGNVFEYSEMELDLMAGDFGCKVEDLKNVLEYAIKLELLFNKSGFINSDSLDERLLPVYEKRNKNKELSKQQLRANGKFISNNTDSPVVSVTEIPQSKVKEIKVKEIKIPTQQEFLEHCKFIIPDQYKSLEFSLKAKYETWEADGWEDGHGSKIKNWKLKIKNTIPFLKPIYGTPIQITNTLTRAPQHKALDTEDQ